MRTEPKQVEPRFNALPEDDQDYLLHYGSIEEAYDEGFSNGITYALELATKLMKGNS